MQLVDNDSVCSFLLLLLPDSGSEANTQFISQLTALFQSSVDHGTIWLTHKRLTYVDGEGDVAMKDAEPKSDSSDDREYPCLLRCTNGKEAKFSTKILPSELHKFTSIYGSLLKSSMSTLRKRDKKREKQRQEQAAARKQRMTEPLDINVGAKRGSGRRKWQRKMKLARKQAESQVKFRERDEKARRKKGGAEAAAAS